MNVDIDDFEALQAEIATLSEARAKLLGLHTPGASGLQLAIEALDEALARLNAAKIEAYYARKGVDSDPQA